MSNTVLILGSFVVDVAFRAARLPAWGETIMGSNFALGPGGKGSNQAVAAARAGGRVSFISKLGHDPFGDLARATYAAEGIDTRHLLSTSTPTGAAAIIIDAHSGENAIIVVPGACFELTPHELDGMTALIAASAIFVTQLELALPTVKRGLELAHSLKVPTILNPAPARNLPASIFPCCDFITPNETEAEILTGIRVTTRAGAERAADALLALGVRNVIVTLGSEGVLVKNSTIVAHIPAFDAGPVIETTGAGDAFTGGLAVALAEGKDVLQAARFGCAVAGLSVTRPGTAPSMPTRPEVDALLNQP